MSPLEEQQFELLLTTNESLQQALVEVTQIGVALADETEFANKGKRRPTVTRQPQALRSSPKAYPARARGFATAIAIAVCAFPLAWLFSASDSVDEHASELVSVWAEQSDSEQDIAIDLDETGPDLDVPDWMLTALASADFDIEDHEEL